MSSGRWRTVLAVTAALVVIAPLAWMWQQSRMPAAYSVMDMGYPSYGGEARPAHQMHGMKGVSVTSLTADPKRPADVRVKLVTRVDSTSGAMTINGRTPGPTITATKGDLVEVRVHNASVPGGVSLHWHGVDVPNAEDGVAGVTQNAIAAGHDHTYRFVVDRVGTYWYHSHQLSDLEVRRGLLGALVVLPPRGIAEDHDVLALSHLQLGAHEVNGRRDPLRVPARPGQTARIRIINTDNGALATWASGPFRVLAIDGTDVRRPTPVSGRTLDVPAGGRADLAVTVPRSGAVRVQLSGSEIVVGSRSMPRAPRRPVQHLDPLTYGSPPGQRPLAGTPDRRFRYSIGRRPGFLDGKPGLWWSINGHLYPDVPMFMVREGDLVAVHIDNHSGETHPMHLHGHHAVVVAQDGHRATGSPWWVDSIEVPNGHSVDLRFRADNPGIWMDHCHNLPHASQGLVTHLMYEGVTTPYRVGGRQGNDPE